METNIRHANQQQLNEINVISEALIRKSYLAGYCRSIWILGQDDDMDLN